LIKTDSFRNNVFDEGFKKRQDHDQDGMTFLNFIVKFMVEEDACPYSPPPPVMLMEELHCV
jgi:hypothetical protein